MTNPTPTTWDLTGKTAVVTGGARGIGAATAALLRERGASVVVSDLSETVRAQESERCATLVGDASDEDVARATVELAVKRFGGLDILVNNAGRTLNKPVTETSVEDFDAIMATNARGNFVHVGNVLTGRPDLSAVPSTLPSVDSTQPSAPRNRIRALSSREPRPRRSTMSDNLPGKVTSRCHEIRKSDKFGRNLHSMPPACWGVLCRLTRLSVPAALVRKPRHVCCPVRLHQYRR